MARGELCDLHSHFLPGMDDGCKNVEEALQVLTYSYAQGITAMFATPHYYPVESVEAFLQRRSKAADTLKEAMKGQAVPQIALGAEVAFRPGISYEEDLEKLCLGNSKFLLLELPFSRWGQELLRELRNISSVRGLTPILAHIERYRSIQGAAMLEQVLQMDVLVQMNAESLLRFSDRRNSCKLLKSGKVQLLGSDCHNTVSRPQNLHKALEQLSKRSMDEVVGRACTLSMDIFRKATGE